MAKVTLIQGVGKTLPFRIKNVVTGAVENLSGARFILWAKENPDADYAVLIKGTTDFDTSAAAVGFISVYLSPTDTYLSPWVYLAELQIITNDTPPIVEKIPFELEVLHGIGPTDLELAATGIVSLEAVGAPSIT